MVICDICKKPITTFIWHNVPINGLTYENVCDHCAKCFTKAFLEENSPQFSREAASHIKEYNKAVILLSSINEED